MSEVWQLILASLGTTLIVAVIAYILIIKQYKFASTIKKGDLLMYQDLNVEVLDAEDPKYAIVKMKIPKTRLSKIKKTI